jgi:hypothetical protein
MLILVESLCFVRFINLIDVVTHVQRQKLALLLGLPEDRDRIQETETSSFNWAHLKMEAESSLHSHLLNKGQDDG